MRIVYFVILISLVGLIVGCTQFNMSKEPSGQIQPPIPTDNQDVADLRPDEVIGREVRNSLNLANSAGTVGIVVEVSNGVVILHGYASNQGIAWQAEAAAHSVQGVKEVYNQITLPGQ